MRWSLKIEVGAQFVRQTLSRRVRAILAFGWSIESSRNSGNRPYLSDTKDRVPYDSPNRLGLPK